MSDLFKISAFAAFVAWLFFRAIAPQPASAGGGGLTLNLVTAPLPGKKPTRYSGGALSQYEVYELAQSMWKYGLSVNAHDLVATAWVESSYRPDAYRAEPRIGDASTGLMQTLLGTANWLYQDKGYTRFGRPTAETLKDPLVSMYFGAAYWDWLKKAYPRKSLEWYARAYNGGPGHNYNNATSSYWAKWKAKRNELNGVTVYF